MAVEDILEIRNLLRIPVPLDGVDQQPDSGDETADHGGGESDLHVVGHFADVARGEAGQRGAHRDQCAHESEHRADFGQELGAFEFAFVSLPDFGDPFFAFELVPAECIEFGEVADELIETDGGYYVLQMVTTFDEEKTNEQKETILSQRKSDLYTETLDGWKEDAKISTDSDLLTELDFTDTYQMKETETETSTDTTETETGSEAGSEAETTEAATEAASEAGTTEAATEAASETETTEAATEAASETETETAAKK